MPQTAGLTVNVVRWFRIFPNFKLAFCETSFPSLICGLVEQRGIGRRELVFCELHVWRASLSDGCCLLQYFQGLTLCRYLIVAWSHSQPCSTLTTQPALLSASTNVRWKIAHKPLFDGVSKSCRRFARTKIRPKNDCKSAFVIEQVCELPTVVHETMNPWLECQRFVCQLFGRAQYPFPKGTTATKPSIAQTLRESSRALGAARSGVAHALQRHPLGPGSSPTSAKHQLLRRPENTSAAPRHEAH